MRPVASFTIARTEIVRADGSLAGKLPAFAESRAELVRLYRAMVLTRAFDAKAIGLQRTGRLGTFPSSLGQEAVVVGVGAAMRAEDVLLPSFREQGAQLWRGVTLVEALSYWGGDERGSCFSRPARGLPDLRAGRHPGAPRGRRGARVQAQGRAARGGLRVRRRRQFQGRCLRGHEPRRSVATAGACSSSTTTSGRSPCRARRSRPPRRWRRRRSPRASPASRSTATTSSPCGPCSSGRWAMRAATARPRWSRR